MMDQPLNLVHASAIVETALQRARSSGLKPLTVAVLDSGGHLVALKREDGAGILRVEIATGKAWGALGLGVGSRALAERAQSHPSFFVSLAAASQGRVVPAAGGVLLRTESGAIVGAVGISGDMPDQDESCALAGIAATPFQPDTGTQST